MCGVETACDPIANTTSLRVTEQSGCFRCTTSTHFEYALVCTLSAHGFYYTATLEAGRDFDLPRHSHYSGVIPVWCRSNIIVGGEIFTRF